MVDSDATRLTDVMSAVRNRFGNVSNKAIGDMAPAPGLHPVEVEEAALFLAFLNREPRGRDRIRMSRTPIPMIKGAEAVAQAFAKAPGMTTGGTSADGVFTPEWTGDIGMVD